VSAYLKPRWLFLESFPDLRKLLNLGSQIVVACGGAVRGSSVSLRRGLDGDGGAAREAALLGPLVVVSLKDAAFLKRRRVI